jgi:enoyl-CoA hydratase/carnithine racemase
MTSYAQQPESAEVLRNVVDGVGWIVFNRPSVSNAAYPPMMRAVCEAIDAFDADPSVRAIALRGMGRHFLAGGDFDWLVEIAEGRAGDAAEEIYRWFQGATRRLVTCAKPTVAAISGGAFTVGAELALACDVRLVDRSAYFSERWLDLGLIAPLGGAMWLPRIIGLGRAKEMLLECRQIGAEEAVAIGLASEMLETSDSLHRRAQERALAMSQRSPPAFARMKQLIHDGMDAAQEDGWQAGVAAQGDLLKSDEFRAAVQARRRSPVQGTR